MKHSIILNARSDERHTLPPLAKPHEHPYAEIYEREYSAAITRELQPTVYFFEALAYHERAAHLQGRNLGMQSKKDHCGDELQEQVKIYDTVNRWYAGFSNAPQEMFLGPKNPKHQWNIDHGFATPGYRGKFTDRAWFYLFLIHRITGSGASFALPGGKLAPHGWCNTPLPWLCEKADSIADISRLIAEYKGPMFTSIGNQIPPFNKPTIEGWTGGREYLVHFAPKLANYAYDTLQHKGGRVGIQGFVDWVLAYQKSQGHKQFKFVLTAWVMDLAEYFPDLVDPKSACYHGKNAIEAIELCFNRPKGVPKQNFYDIATQLFADTFQTRPMDVEDAAPGCDLIRWLENYVQERSYPNVDRKAVFNSSFIRHPYGRQPWNVEDKLVTNDI